MALNGGFKPRPNAFIKYFKNHNLNPKRIFFIGNRLVDMELATAIKKEIKCQVFKCLINRSEKTIALKHADKIIRNLKQASDEINKFKPDIILSDFDNTLFYTGHDSYERIAEKTMFWEKHGKNKPLIITYSIISLIINAFIKRKPYNSKYDNTLLFIKTLKQPLIIHSMSSELIINKTINKLLKEN